MALHLSPRIQARITDMVEQGDYPSVDALLDQALDMLDDDGRLNHLRDLVARGTEQARRGELISYTEEFREEAKLAALRRFAQGDRPGADVCP